MRVRERGTYLSNIKICSTNQKKSGNLKLKVTLLPLCAHTYLTPWCQLPPRHISDDLLCRNCDNQALTLSLLGYANPNVFKGWFFLSIPQELQGFSSQHSQFVIEMLKCFIPTELRSQLAHVRVKNRKCYPLVCSDVPVDIVTGCILSRILFNTSVFKYKAVGCSSFRKHKYPFFYCTVSVCEIL